MQKVKSLIVAIHLVNQVGVNLKYKPLGYFQIVHTILDFDVTNSDVVNRLLFTIVSSHYFIWWLIQEKLIRLNIIV